MWQDIEQRFPQPISDMRSAFSRDDGKNIRAFVLKDSFTVFGDPSEPIIEFHTDMVPELLPAVLLLKKHGFVTDITTNSVPMFRVDETLIDRLTIPDEPFWKRW